MPEGTVAGRLTRARSFLQASHAAWVVLPGGAFCGGTAQNMTSAKVPNSVVSSTIKAVSLLAAGQTMGVISTKVAVVVEGVLKTMFMAKLKITAVVLLMCTS